MERFKEPGYGGSKKKMVMGERIAFSGFSIWVQGIWAGEVAVDAENDSVVSNPSARLKVRFFAALHFCGHSNAPHPATAT